MVYIIKPAKTLGVIRYCTELIAIASKASIFGGLLTFIGCYFGYTTSGGAQGVGNATTKAVVASAVMILATDYIITSFLITIKLA